MELVVHRLDDRDFLAEMELSLKRSDLFHQVVDKFLREQHTTCALMPCRPSSKTWNRPQGPAPTMRASVSITLEFINFVLVETAPL
jgi:hypothetical protein